MGEIRQDYSQKLYEKYLKGIYDSVFPDSEAGEFKVSNMGLANLKMSGVISDGAMFFTTDKSLYIKLMFEEQKNAMKERIRTEMACNVYDFAKINKKGFYLPDNLPVPFNNVVVISEADIPSGGNTCLEGRKTMIFSHKPDRLVEAAGMAIDSLTVDGSRGRDFSVDVSLGNMPANMSCENISSGLDMMLRLKGAIDKLPLDVM